MQFIKYIILPALTLLVSCKKEKPEPEIPADKLENCFLILNEGLFQMNNSGLSWVSASDLSVNNSFFEGKTGRKLGDTGNDMKRYGNKIYVLVNVSSTLEILDAASGNPVKQISFVNGNQSKQPRAIAFFGSKAFISCFDGYVDVLDTAALVVEKRIHVGLNPDQIVATDSKIVVSNSGGLNAPVMDSTLSVIDPISLTEEQQITVGKNPGSLQLVNGGLFVIVRGNHGTIPPVLKKIDPLTFEILDSYTFKPLIMEKMDSKLLIAYDDNGTIRLGLFNTVNNSWQEASFMDVSGIETLYTIHYESKNNRIYLFDAHGYTVSGEILEYSSSGNKLREFTVGLNPNALLFFE
ncbi:MAG: YncE family protein [Bacteroidota bacterium]